MLLIVAGKHRPHNRVCSKSVSTKHIYPGRRPTLILQNYSSLFIFNPSDFAPRPTGIFHDGSSSENELLGITHGPHYTRRLINAVHSLRHRLRSLGGELIVRIGNPLLIIPSLLSHELHNVVNEVAWSEISDIMNVLNQRN